MAAPGTGAGVNRMAWPFRGGVRLSRHKEHVAGKPSRELPLPPRLVYPLRAHIGLPATPAVRVGQRVLKGECIATPPSYVSQAVHAATSGTVVEISSQPVAHASGMPDTCIVIEPDGEDRAVDRWPALDYESEAPAVLQARIVEAGIIGMGGAGFPSHVKIREGMSQAVAVLIINGVECEPYVSCDDCVIRERPAQVVAGARILKRAVQAQACIIAIEEDMSEAGDALLPFLDADITLARVPAIYPAGAEKQLIVALTGIEVPTRGLPIQAGFIMQNVATTFAVYDAVAAGHPLTSRMVTVAGGVAEAANMWARLGTPVSHLIDACGGAPSNARLVIGGPMMGTAVHDERVPVGKTTNCVLAMTEVAASAPVMPCIRCGECVERCPVGLQPQALYEFARARDWDSAQDWRLFDCIECGVCAYVCPSRLPLVHYYRYAKSEIESLERADHTAAELRERFQARRQRLSRAETERMGDAVDQVVRPQREQPQADKSSATNALRAEVAAAVARGRTRRRTLRSSPGGPSPPDPEAKPE
ncbi:MAG: electron transport complex subunit RsxC [Chromatiales bacterium]